MAIEFTTLVDDVMRRCPATIRVFLDYRMHCVGCPIACFHTVDDACREHNPETKVVFAGTRSQYGRTRSLPVTEDHPQVPTDINGANKIAAERYHLVYHAMHGLRACSLRLTNTYGPRQLMAHGRQGFMMVGFINQ